jgi:hypothetical protein
MGRVISNLELFRRLEQVENGEFLNLHEVRGNEEFVLDTDTAIYRLKVLSPKYLIVTVRSLQDPDFEQDRICGFQGSIWDDVPFAVWSQAPMNVPGCLLRGCYPVISIGEKVVVLPKVFKIERGGKPLFEI